MPSIVGALIILVLAVAIVPGHFCDGVRNLVGMGQLQCCACCAIAKADTRAGRFESAEDSAGLPSLPSQESKGTGDV